MGRGRAGPGRASLRGQSVETASQQVRKSAAGRAVPGRSGRRAGYRHRLLADVGPEGVSDRHVEVSAPVTVAPPRPRSVGIRHRPGVGSAPDPPDRTCRRLALPTMPSSASWAMVFAVSTSGNSEPPASVDAVKGRACEIRAARDRTVQRQDGNLAAIDRLIGSASRGHRCSTSVVRSTRTTSHAGSRHRRVAGG